MTDNTGVFVGDEREVQSGISSINQEFKEREVQNRAEEMKLKYINLTETPINPDVIRYIPREVSLKMNIIPFYEMGKNLKIALTNPENKNSQEVINILKKKFNVDSYLCSEESLHFAQRNYEQKFYHKHEEVVAYVDEKLERNLEKELEEAKKLPKKIAEANGDVALNALNELASRLGISDFHFQPHEDGVYLRGRIDGALTTICDFPISTAEVLIRQIKHDADLKYNVTDKPQDGKYAYALNEREVDVRVSTFPANFGESVVLRFLDAKKGIVPLEKLGFLPLAKKRFLDCIHKTNGIILVTGPTGSGKTTTLYSALDTINDDQKKIITLEDPIEFRLKGILQSQVDEKKGFTFEVGLRSILRQDPDIILVGEIRDQITAETAVQSALTGHLVFSTLHTNSAADAIPRLMNMGIKPFSLAPAIKMIVAQRLLRTLCDCKEKKAITEEEKAILIKALPEENIPPFLYHPRGCQKCGRSGYRGQTGAIEVLQIDDEIRSLIFGDFASHNISALARKKGMRSMWQEGIKKVIMGETTIDELKNNIDE